MGTVGLPATINQPVSARTSMIARRRVFTLPGENEHFAACIKRCESGDAVAVKKWEREVADYVGVGHAAVVSSGRRGLVLTLSHFGLTSGDELILPAYTFDGLLPPIRDLGIKPVPADIDARRLCVTPESVEARITPRTKAILILHPFGVPCDAAGIVEVARRHSLPVIEDCAHSLGATINGRQTGSFGDAAFFSFQAIKPVNTFGGGMVVSNDETLVNTVRDETAAAAYDLKLLKSKIRIARVERYLYDKSLVFPLLYLLATPPVRHLAAWMYHRTQPNIPPNFRYTPVQAEVGSMKLQSLDERIDARACMSALLASLLRSDIKVHQAPAGCRSTQYMFVAELPVPAVRVRKRLLLKGIDAGIEDELTDHCAKLIGYEDCPTLNAVYPRLISLPLYDGITEEEMRRVAGVVNSAF